MGAPDNNLKHPSEAAALGAQVAKVVAWVSGIFSLVACITLILAQVQIMMVDPLNDPTLKAMKAQIMKDQKNEQLRQSVRSLHLLSRRAFFTNQTQQRATGALLLFGVAIFLASMKTYVELRLRLPVPQGQAPREGGSAERAAGRWAVTAGAGLVVLSTLFWVFLSPPPIDFDTKPAEAATAGAGTPGAGNTDAPKEAGSGSKPSGETPGKLEPPPLHAWPMFRGPYGQGVALHNEAPKEWDGKSKKNIRWVAPIPKPGANSPIVWDKVVVVSGGDNEGRAVYAFDTDTGKPLWEGKVGSAGDGGVKKLNASTGYCAPSMATDGERVFAVVATGEVNAFTMDGKPAWPGNLGAPKIQYGYGSSLAVFPGRVLIQLDTDAGGRLVALDAKTGKKIFDKARAGVTSSWASPVLAVVGGKPQLLLAGNPFGGAHDPVTGEAIWRANWTEGAAGVEVAPSPAYANGIVFFAVERAGLVAVKAGDEKPLWKYESDSPDISSPVATDKYVLMAASSGVLTCLDAATGKKLWTNEFDIGFESSPIVVGDLVYLVDKKGFTNIFKLGEKYEQVARNALGEDCSSTPAIPKGRIYLRTKTNLYCIGKD